jgi:hypothetical protein
VITAPEDSARPTRLAPGFDVPIRQERDYDVARGEAMTQAHVLTAIIALLAVLFIGEAMRRGLGRALAAMAVIGIWLGVTLAVLRSFPNRGASGDAVRNYVVIMSLTLFCYFRGSRWLARRASPASTDGLESPLRIDPRDSSTPRTPIERTRAPVDPTIEPREEGSGIP